MESKEYKYRVNFYSNENQSVSDYLLNKDILCIKEVVDRDFKTKILLNEVVKIKKVEVGEIRENTMYIEIHFVGQNREDKIDLFFDCKSEYTLLSNIKSLFLPIKNLYELWSLK